MNTTLPSHADAPAALVTPAATPSVSTPTLAELQAALQAHILTGEMRIAPAVLDRGGLSVASRLAVYHDAYRWRLVEVMQDHFAMSHRYLGDAFFQSEAMAYVLAHPSRHHSLREFGAEWPHWLASRFPTDTDMADLARLEWALRHAFDAADAPVLSLADLGHIAPDAWGRVGFRLAPGTCVLHLGHAVGPLWQGLQSETPVAPPEAQATCLRVWRQGWQPHFKSISVEEASAVEALLAGHTFQEACAFLDGHPQGEQLAAQWLQAWAQEGLLASVLNG